MGAIHHNSFTEKMYDVVPRGYFLRDNSVSYSEDKTEREYSLFKRNVLKSGYKKLASFHARALPGCCGILVVYYLRPVEAKESTFNYVLKLIVKAAGNARFGGVLLTQTFDSLGYSALVKLEGSQKSCITNYKTGNSVTTFMIQTEYKEPKKVKEFEGE